MSSIPVTGALSVLLVAALVGAGHPAAAMTAAEATRPRCTVSGTDSADHLESNAPNAVVCAGAGNDVIVISGAGSRVYGDDGDDVITYTGAARPALESHLEGGAGRDRITGGRGGDWIDGGAGADVITGGSGDDIIRGGAGADAVRGGSGNDYIDGGDCDDVLAGDANTIHDQLRGDTGDDVLLPGTGVVFADWFDGGDGDDVVIPSPVRLSPLGNQAKGGEGSDFLLTLNGMPDVYNPGAGVVAEVPGSPCKVTFTSADAKRTQLTCSLPWKRLPKCIARDFDLTISADPSGHVGVGGDVAVGLLSLDVASWRKLLHGSNGAITADTSIVDPRIAPWAPADLEF